MRAFVIGVMLIGVAAGGFATDASAKPKKHIVKPQVVGDLDTSSLNGIPLTVNRRSWLDSGNVVRSSSIGGQAYVAANTEFHKTEDRIIDPDKFGNDVIKGQPYVPGRTVALAEFETERDGRPRLDGFLGAQNYYFNPAPPEAPSLPAAIPFFPDR